MKASLIALAVSASLSTLALAEPTLYGKANVSLQANDENGASTTELVSNASRIGVKGSQPIDENLTAVYQAEFEVDIDGDSEDTFSQRNIFVGLEGDSWGQVIAGKFDTPMKEAAGDVDLFNDLEADIKSIITKSENRLGNSVQYSTPGSLAPFVVSFDYIAAEEEDLDDGVSTSLTFEQDNLYLALAYDMDVEKQDANVLRLVGRIELGELALGALYEDQDAGSSSLNDGDGWLVSAAYSLNDKTTLKAQYGQSDIVTVGGDTLSLGVDYKLHKQVKLFGFYTSEEADSGLDNDYLGAGIEVKF